jgi:hypothetical protein
MSASSLREDLAVPVNPASGQVGQEECVGDFMGWVRSLSQREKALVRRYILNERVKDEDEDLDLRYSYAERYVKIPEDAFRRICVAMGASATEPSAIHAGNMPSAHAGTVHAETPSITELADAAFEGQQQSTCTSTPQLGKRSRPGQLHAHTHANQAGNNESGEIQSLQEQSSLKVHACEASSDHEIKGEESGQFPKRQRTGFPVDVRSMLDPHLLEDEESFHGAGQSEKLDEVYTVLNAFVSTCTEDSLEAAENRENTDAASGNVTKGGWGLQLSALEKTSLILETLILLRESVKLELERSTSSEMTRARRLEPALRKLLIDDSWLSLLTTRLRAHVRDLSMQLYSCVLQAYSSDMDALLGVVKPLLPECVRPGGTRELCSRWDATLSTMRMRCFSGACISESL